MMLALSGRDRDFDGTSVTIDPFRFYLAEQLGLRLAEVDGMTEHEYMEWHAYYTAKLAMQNQRPVAP